MLGTKDFEDKYLNNRGVNEKQEYCINELKSLRLHILGDVNDATHLMKKYQPSEPEWAIDYKKANFRPITKKAVSKIFNVLSKIQRANDFVIKANKNSPKVAENETLDNYCLNNFGDYYSIQNWFFNYHFDTFFADANGVVLFIPYNIYEFIEGELKELVINPTEYLKPLPFYFSSEDILENDSEFLLVKFEDNKFIHVDSANYTLIERKEINRKISYTYTLLYTHNLGYVPKVVNGGRIKQIKNETYYESFISSVVPDFDQALLENIDKNVAIKMHIYPEKAIYGQYSCHDCSGTGQYETYRHQTREVHTCNTCSGTGVLNTSAFGVIQVRPSKGGESETPTWAPAKYIEKDLKSLEFITEDIKYLLQQGYEAVNMAHLGEAPMNTSGKSKAYDWEQTHLFLYKVADYICQTFLKECIYVINDLRYKYLLEDRKVLDEQLLIINTPQNFDILGVSEIEEQIANAKRNGISPSIQEELEKDYIRKKFVGDTKQLNIHLNIIELDPLRGTSQDEILTMQSLGSISKETITLHNLINQFVYKAFEEVPNFAEKKLIERYMIVENYAKEYLKTFETKLVPLQ